MNDEKVLIISGAITELDSIDALKHAKMYYEEIRHMTTDVAKISENTHFSLNDILAVKQYLFIDKHNLGEGMFERFYPCLEIAQSWQRLAFDKDGIQKHDITLLNHEILEIEYVYKDGLSQDEAHRRASMFYNYQEESNDYYKDIDMKQGKLSKEEIEEKWRGRY